MNTESSTIEKIISWGLIAAFGGAVKYISAVIRSNDILSNRRFFMLLAANIFISSFCGLMGGLTVTTLTADHNWQYLACGVFGYLGTQGLDIAILTVKKKFSPSVSITSVVPVPPSVDSQNP